jgi:hypothetical protein
VRIGAAAYNIRGRLADPLPGGGKDGRALIHTPVCQQCAYHFVSPEGTAILQSRVEGVARWDRRRGDSVEPPHVKDLPHVSALGVIGHWDPSRAGAVRVGAPWRVRVGWWTNQNGHEQIPSHRADRNVHRYPRVRAPCASTLDVMPTSEMPDD